MFSKLYDLIVFITNNYSSMPEEFRNQFPENVCINLRLGISAIDSSIENFENDEK